MNKETRKCPFCGEEISLEVQKCPYCCESLASEVSENVNMDLLETNEGVINTLIDGDKLRGKLSDDVVHAISERTVTTQSSSNSQHQEDTYKRPLLKKQNFEQAKMWSLVLLILPVVCIFVGLFYIIRSDASEYFPVVFLASVLAYTIPHFVLLNNILKYMQNFEVSPNLATNIRCVQVSIVGILLLLPFFRMIQTGDMGDMIVEKIVLSILLFGLGIFYFVTYLLTGICIYKARSKDFIGGTDTLGVFIIVGLFFNLMCYFIPLFTYKMFSKAQEYSDKYGFAPDPN